MLRLHRAGRTALAGSALLLASACSRRSPDTPALRLDASAQVELSDPAVAAGQPVAIRYCWKTGPGFVAPPRAYRAFVHLLGDDGTVLVGDDHPPEPDVRTWQAGAEYRYDRVIFTRYQFPGPLRIRLGLFDPEGGARVALSGDADRQLAYVVGKLQVTRALTPRARFLTGFSAPVVDPNEPFEILRRMEGSAELSLVNPRTDALLLVRSRAPRRPDSGPLRLLVAVGGGERADVLHDEQPRVLALPLRAAQLGGEPWTTVSLRAGPRTSLAARGLWVSDAVLLPRAELSPGLQAWAEAASR